MAQQDHVAGAGGLDACDSGHGEHVTLLDFAIGDRRRGVGRHEDLAAGHGTAVCRILRGDVDHARPSHGIEVGEGEIAHVSDHTSKTDGTEPDTGICR